MSELHHLIDDSAGPDGCWPWTGYKDGHGYGVKYVGRRGYLKAHRWAYIQVHGEIPAGLCVLHRCDNPPCCNPAHLFAGTHGDNMRDMFAKGRGRPGRMPGSSNPAAKLTETDIPQIRTLKANGSTVLVIARRFGVDRKVIYDILAGKIWAHV